MSTVTPGMLQRFAADPAAFRAHVIVDRNGEAVLFDKIMDPRQRAEFAAGDPGWRQAIGLPPNGDPKRVWSTRPRGSSKTTDAAVDIVYAMAFAPDRATGIAASGSFDQCRIIAQAVQRKLDLNPWLQTEVIDRDTGRRSPMLVCQNGKIRNARTGSETIILPADSHTTFGHLADWIVIDEICNWPAAGENLWTTLASTIAKRPRAMAKGLTNAGWLDSWQRRIYDAVSIDSRWLAFHWDSPPAWMSQSLLDEQRALLPPGQYARLVENRWSTGSGDMFDDADVLATQTLDGPPSLTNIKADRRPHFAGLDLSTRRDHSALVVLAADPKTQRVELRYCKTWRPAAAGIDLSAIRAEAIRVAKLFRCEVIADPFQASLMLEDLRAAGVRATEMPFSGPALNTMASKLLQAVRERRLDLWNEPELVTGLRRLNIVERGFGSVRLTATRDAVAGHSDAAIAMSIALPFALDEATSPYVDSDIAGLALIHSRAQRHRLPRVY